MANTDVYAQLAAILRSLDLGELVGTTASGSPSGWLANQIQAGVDTDDELYLAIEQTDVFRQRYGAIVEQRRRAAEGEPIQPMTVADVRRTEDQFRSVARYYDLPRSMYDHYTDFQEMILEGITPEQFEASAARSYAAIQAAPPEVRQVFAEWFGPQGDSVLAAYWMQPDKVTANAGRIVDTAIAGGISRQYGFGIDRQTADTLAYRGVTPNDLAAGYSQIQAQADLFRESISESRDLTQAREGVAAQFNLPGGGQAQRDLRQRVQGRIAQFQGGGAALTRATGVVGVGAAE